MGDNRAGLASVCIIVKSEMCLSLVSLYSLGSAKYHANMPV